MDNNSTDSTPEILNEYARRDSRIKVLQETEQGVLHPRNKGLREARGRWIAVLDSDDIALPNRFESQMSYIAQNPQVILVGSGCILIDSDGNPLKIYQYPNDHAMLVDCLENKKAFFPHTSAVFKRDIALEIGGYRLPHGEDYDLWLRFVFHGSMACLQDPLVKLRTLLTSNSYRIPQDEYVLCAVMSLLIYFRKKKGLSDPFALPETREDFLAWVQQGMKTLGCFRKALGSRELTRVRHLIRRNKAQGVFQLCRKILFNSDVYSFLADRSFVSKAAWQLAEESEAVYSH